jgi:hypothetical protein
MMLAGHALPSCPDALPDSLLCASSGDIQQQQHPAGENSIVHDSRGPFAAASMQQQTMHALKHSSDGPAGPAAGNGPQLMPSADFALFAQLHLHNPAPASRQLQQQHSATPQHPIIESFPSFSKHHSNGLQNEVLQQAADEAAAAFEAAAVKADSQDSPETTGTLVGAGSAATAAAAAAAVHAPRPVSSEASPASSSSDAALLLSSSGSPLMQLQQQPQQQHSHQQHSARKVSLLSQQIACARSRAPAADVAYGAAGSERGVGSTHHHASEFWQYIQVRRISGQFILFSQMFVGSRPRGSLL